MHTFFQHHSHIPTPFPCLPVAYLASLSYPMVIVWRLKPRGQPAFRLQHIITIMKPVWSALTMSLCQRRSENMFPKASYPAG
jgi:hypothetical protein